MTLTLPPSRPLRRASIWAVFVLIGLGMALAFAGLPTAQVSGERGIAPVASTGDIEIGGIEVDERGDTAEEARQAGWESAQRKAWEKLGGASIPDSQIQSMVSAIVIEQERIGPRRYIATLGVVFDRSRAGQLLGAGGRRQRSAPMLLVPVTVSGGTELVYETRNPWQQAWAEYQAGGSAIDYVRPSGAGGDSLLVTYGQTSRRSRTWWRTILDQVGAADVLMPIARLQHQFPGGPIEGTFTARYGPDNTYLTSFTMSADSPAALPAMLERAVRRFDTIFEQALAEGTLTPNPTLDLGPSAIDPAISRLLEIGRAAEARERAAAQAARDREAATTGDSNAAPAPEPTPTATATQAAASSFVVQFASPDAGAVDATLAAVRATPGVGGASTRSIAIGGTSVMSVSYNGDLAGLAAALRARGFTVRQGPNALAISR